MIQKKLDSAQNALKNKDFKKAKKLFEEAISINPKLPEVHNILGNIELNFWNLKETVKFFQKAFELKPNFSGALCNLGLAFKRLKNEKLAINNYLKAINVDAFKLKKYSFVKKSEIKNYPISRLIDKFLEENNII